MLARTKAHADEVISLLDIGSFKTTCLIISRRAVTGSPARAPFRVLGIGQCRGNAGVAALALPNHTANVENAHGGAAIVGRAQFNPAVAV